MSSTPLERMLGARSIAVVGASARPGSFGERLTLEALRSPSAPTVHLVHPSHREVLGRSCVPSLSDLPDPVDLVLLGVPDAALADQLELAGDRGDGGAVVFGSAHGLGERLGQVADRHGLALCGGGCMGFVNVAEGVRAIGYLERFPLTTGPIALVTHSGSVFSALLRTHRKLEFSLAVSSGQEIVTTTADYLSYALSREETRVVGLVSETLRDVPALRRWLSYARERDVPVVALTVGASPTGRAMVAAHSGALAGDDAAWEALCEAHGVHRVADLDEMADTLELFALGRRADRAGTGIATVHDSGAERALVADVASAEGVPFAPLVDSTRARLAAVLDPGLEAVNPLDVWGTGAGTEGLFTECLTAMTDDPSVSAVALAIDLVPELDGDESYPRAVETAAASTTKPVVVLSNLAASLDQAAALRLRTRGIPVLEGTRSGLRALRHLLDHAAAGAVPAVSPRPARVDHERQRRWQSRLLQGPLDATTSLALLADYGIAAVASRPASDIDAVLRAANLVGWPVVLKTDEPGVVHKSDVSGVVIGLDDPVSVREAYARLRAVLGPRAVVQRHIGEGTEAALGVVRDPLLGPMVLLAAGGTLVELMNQRAVALPPVNEARAAAMLERLPFAALLDGVRGRPPGDRRALVAAVVALSTLAVELGGCLEALDVNPLVVGPEGAVAVDALVVVRSTAETEPLAAVRP
ncbi:MAG: acetate--CoA ligase family protein [Nocardioidaceae bacterium]